ncbi:MAG: hypothetical protein R3C59_29265 [Planctomycetaceae bacterium]
MCHVSVRSVPNFVPTLVVLLTTGLLNGCGGNSPVPPDSAAPSAAAAASEENTAAPAAATAGTPATVSASTDVGRSRAPNERWKDANGVEYLGDVPLDVFFDQPYAVASDATPLGGTAPAGDPATGIPAVSMTAGNMAPSAAGGSDTSPAASSPASVAASGGATGSNNWDELLPIKDLDEEVTTIRNFLNEALQSVGSYNSSMLMIPPKAASLAALCTIMEQHSGDVSWKEDAAYIRDLAKKMNESDLQRGKKDQSRLLMLFENMTDTFNRSRPAGLEEPPADDSFSDVAEMRLLMMRMESAEKKMKNEAGSETAFASQKDIVLHEAALLGTMSKVVTQSGYGYEDDAEFVGYAQKIVDAAKEIREAAESGSFSTYELALSKVSGACQECHSAYKNN